MRSANMSGTRARAAAAGAACAAALPLSAQNATVAVQAPVDEAVVAEPAETAGAAQVLAVVPAAAALVPPAAPAQEPAAPAQQQSAPAQQQAAVPALPAGTAAAAAALQTNAAGDLANIRQLYTNGAFDTALARVSAARFRYPQHLELAVEHCRVSITAGCYTAALGAADKVLANVEASPAQKSLAQQTRARALLNLGRHAEARHLCNTEITDDATRTALRAIADLNDHENGYSDLLGTLQNQPQTQTCEMAVAAAYVAAKQRATLAIVNTPKQRGYSDDAAAAVGYAQSQGHVSKPVWRAATAVANFLFGNHTEREDARRTLRNGNLGANPLAALTRLLPSLQTGTGQREIMDALRNVITLLNTEPTWVPAHAVRATLLIKAGTAEQRRIAINVLKHRFADQPDNLGVVSLIAALQDRNNDWQGMLDTLNAGIAALAHRADAEEDVVDILTPRMGAANAPAQNRAELFDAVAQGSDLDEQLLRAHTKLRHWHQVDALLERLRTYVDTRTPVSPTSHIVIGEAATQLGNHFETMGNKLRAKQLYNWAQEASIASLDAGTGSYELPLRAAQACVDHGRLATPADATDIYQIGLQELENLSEELLCQDQLHRKKLLEARLLLGLQRYDECRVTLRLLNGTPLQDAADRIKYTVNIASAVRERFASVEDMLQSLEMRGSDNPRFHQIITEATRHLQLHPGAPEYLAVRGAAYLQQGRVKKALDDLRLAKIGIPAESWFRERVVLDEHNAATRWANKNILRRSATRTRDFVGDHPYITGAIVVGVAGAAIGADFLLLQGRITMGTIHLFKTGARGAGAGAAGAVGGLS